MPPVWEIVLVLAIPIVLPLLISTGYRWIRKTKTKGQAMEETVEKFKNEANLLNQATINTNPQQSHGFRQDL